MALIPTRTTDGMAQIAGGTFRMGSNVHYPEERPAHSVTVDCFWIDRHAVPNADFAAFVAATDYVTFAERPVDPALYPGARPELLKPGSAVFRRPERPVRPRDLHDWWSYIPGADWAASGRSRQHDRRAGEGAGRACRVRGRFRLRRLGRQGTADRSGVGVRGARRAGRRGILLGR
jgi:formylglycine-generating enzyme required for sulfatase activity